MFRLFDNDLKRIRKLRLEFEDIRQRVIHKMNSYERYSFLSGYQAWEDQFCEDIDRIPDDDLGQWIKVGEVLRLGAQKSWQEARSMSGIAGEGGLAGAQALALLALRCSVRGFRHAEALTLRADISTFEVEMDKLVNEGSSKSSK